MYCSYFQYYNNKQRPKQQQIILIRLALTTFSQLHNDMYEHWTYTHTVAHTPPEMQRTWVESDGDRYHQHNRRGSEINEQN